MDQQEKLKKKTWSERRKDWTDYALKTKNKRLFHAMQSVGWSSYLATRYSKAGKLIEDVQYERSAKALYGDPEEEEENDPWAYPRW